MRLSASVSLGQIFAIGGDYLLVPVKALLLGALEGTVAGVVAVHIDKAVAPGHLARAGRGQIDRTPGGVAQQVDAVLGHRVTHGLDVLAQVVDAVIVVDGAIPPRQRPWHPGRSRPRTAASGSGRTGR